MEGCVFMSRLMWFIIGCFSTLQAVSILPIEGQFSYILTRFIFNPIAFLATALFLIFSFLIISQAISNFLVIFRDTVIKKNQIEGKYFFELFLYIIGWAYLFYNNQWVTGLLFILTMIYIILSFGQTKAEGTKGEI